MNATLENSYITIKCQALKSQTERFRRGFRAYAQLAVPYHGQDERHVPTTDIAVEHGLVLECAGHVGDERHVPLRNRAVLGVRAGVVDADPVLRIIETQSGL